MRKQDMKKSLFIMILLLMALCGGAARSGAQVTVKTDFVPRMETGETAIPNPDKLSDIVRVKADADSKAGIEKITFEVDDQFRFEAKQPPYAFNWDTLEENDGQHTLAVTAYNINGQTGVKRLKVTVENNLKLGIPHFVKVGLAAFSRNDLIGLEKSARKCFKISRIDHDAVRLMALSLGAHNNPGEGFRLLDDQQIGVPKDAPFTLRVRGYLLLFQGMNEGDNVRMVESLEKGFDLVHKQVSGELADLAKSVPETSTDPATQMARGDALFGLRHYESALAAYEKAGSLTQERAAKRRAGHRACMTLLRLNRMQEAESLANRLNNNTDATDTSRGLLAAVLFQKRKYAEAREMARPAAAEKNLVALTVEALSDLALNARPVGLKEAREAAAITDTTETQYTLAAALADNGDQEGAKRAFRSAFLRAPFFTQTLAERAWQTMTYENSDERYAHALNLLELTRSLDPDDPSALAAQVAVLLKLGRYQTAQPLVALLVAQDPLAPDVALLKAITIAHGDQSNAAIKPALDYAQKSDPLNYKDAFLPPMTTLIARLTRLRRIVPLTPELLDAADGLIPIGGS
jgi:tetratricopeptide (TPR) repeat protein